MNIHSDFIAIGYCKCPNGCQAEHYKDLENCIYNLTNCIHSILLSELVSGFLPPGEKLSRKKREIFRSLKRVISKPFSLYSLFFTRKKETPCYSHDISFSGELQFSYMRNSFRSYDMNMLITNNNTNPKYTNQTTKNSIRR